MQIPQQHGKGQVSLIGAGTALKHTKSGREGEGTSVLGRASEEQCNNLFIGNLIAKMRGHEIMSIISRPLTQNAHSDFGIGARFVALQDLLE